MVDSYFVTPGWDNIKLSEPNPKKLIITFRYTVISPSLEFGRADVSWLPSLSICLTSHWTDAVVIHPASILDVSDGVSKPVQCHSVLVRYWFQSWKKMIVSSCNSGHSSILKLQCIVLTNKLTELASCSSAGKVTGLICREHTCRVRLHLHRKRTVNGA